MLVLGTQKTSRFLHLPAGILEIYVGPLLGLVTYTIHMASTTHNSLKAASLKIAQAMGTVGEI